MTIQTGIGVLLAVASISLAQLAKIQLGKSFAVIPKAKDLVTHGLYSRLQNPMYLFLDLAICGVAIAVHRWYVLLPLLLLMPLQIRNSRKERYLLHEKFGERFERYLQGTWF
jgi:protein-S-isoprenylcysteine O-methyltransferase Ste14